MSDSRRTVAALDFGTGGYVRIDAVGVSEEAALDIASDIVAWLRSMNAKHSSIIIGVCDAKRRAAKVHIHDSR